MILHYLFPYSKNINLLLEAGEKGKRRQPQFSAICVTTKCITSQHNNLPDWEKWDAKTGDNISHSVFEKKPQQTLEVNNPTKLCIWRK